MNRGYVFRFVVPLVSLCALLAFAMVAYAGGWATITLNDFPDYAVAGKPLNLSFTVRQHGQTLLPGLQPSVRATTTNGLVAKAAAKSGAAVGEYVAALMLSQPGDWTITIESGFNTSTTTLPALKVIAAGSTAPAPFAAATRGLRLFTAKGCVGCHRHLEVNPTFATDAKFDLTTRRLPQDYLRRFLADPSIKTAEMPNLKLQEDEIDELAAFINKGLLKQAR